MNKDKDLYEEHVIYSYTRICGYYENKKNGFSLQILINYNHFSWPKYFYVIKIKNCEIIDINCDSWNKQFRALGNYNSCIEDICILISLIYWKLFYYLWILKFDWRYSILDYSQNNLKYNYIPWNNKENRIDIKKEINLVTLWPVIERLLLKIKENNNQIGEFLYVVSFYCKWLFNSELDLEISYIDFIRSIEILSNIFYQDSLNWDYFYEWDLLKIWEKIKWDEKLEKYFKKINWSTKKFVNVILGNINLFDLHNIESKWEDFSLKKLKSEKDLKRVLQNAYTIRSEYIHSWKSFWYSILPDKEGINEIINISSIKNKDLKIWETLSLLWLERIVRETLLNYFNNHILW